jgi:hypothetical protein
MRPTIFQEYFGSLKPVKSFGKLGAVYETADGKKVFCKTVVRGTRDRTKHFMWNNRSWGISLEVVQELNKMEVDEIALWVTDEGVIHTDMMTFNAKSTIERYGDFEEQAFLYEGYWK